MILKSALLETLPGVRTFFGAKSTPLPTEAFGALWEETKPLWKQVHGADTATVKVAGQACGEVDGFLTEVPGQPIGVVTADCTPILLGRDDGRAVMALHAGWRGTVRGIIERGLATQDATRWRASLGPAIQSCCFEVGPEVEEIFFERFPDFDRDIIRPRPRHISLSAVQSRILRSLGVEQIESSALCTKCSTHPEFHSYRRNPGEGRQYSCVFFGASTDLINIS